MQPTVVHKPVVINEGFRRELMKYSTPPFPFALPPSLSISTRLTHFAFALLTLQARIYESGQGQRVVHVMQGEVSLTRRRTHMPIYEQGRGGTGTGTGGLCFVSSCLVVPFYPGIFSVSLSFEFL